MKVLTWKKYERRGMIQSQRDINGYCRYSLEEALKLKEILSKRIDELECPPVPVGFKVSQTLL